MSVFPHGHIDRSTRKRVRLGDYATLFAGGTPSRAVSDYYGGTIPWCSISDISNAGKFLTRTEESLTSLGLEKSSAKLIPADAILFAMYASIGECSLATTPLATSQAILGIYNLKGFDREYLYYYLCSRKDAFINQGQTGTQSNLSKETLSNLQLPKPEIEEQCSIAVSLSTIDTNISALQSLIAKYEAIKKATVNLLLKPTGTHMVKLGEVADISRGGSPRPIQDYITADIDGINWIKIGDVSVDAKYIEQTEERIKPTGVAMSRQVKAGDFILSNSMSFGRPYILKIDGCIHDGWLAIQNYQNTFDVDYLYYLLGSDMVFAQYIENAAGSSVKNLNKDIVAKITLPSPPLSEQCKIAEQITAIDKVLADYKAQLEKARQLKAGMMSYFFG